MEKLKSVSTKDGKIELEAFADLNDSLNFSLHVGADSTEDNKIDVDISMMSARGLGVNGLQVSGDDDTKATAAIDTISAAIRRFPPSVPHLVLFRTDLSTPSTTWTT